MVKCINHHLSPSYSYKIFKCRCDACRAWKKVSDKTNDPIKARLRLERWKKRHPGKMKEYQKRYESKKIVQCRECSQPIPRDVRKCGASLCSPECRTQSKNRKIRQSRKLAHQRFSDYKTSHGCVRCGYNIFGGSIDFHHINPDTKERRIEGKHFFSKEAKMADELKKCVMLCKNCHYEMHALYRDNKEEYFRAMDGLKEGAKREKK